MKHLRSSIIVLIYRAGSPGSRILFCPVEGRRAKRRMFLSYSGGGIRANDEDGARQMNSSL
ncbi:MAG: hypothetical protein NTZ35_05740 [Ignavibacteriales bacterium]|nr:hypothetical protein [Ignavibacteriales bacterium]